MIVLSYEDRLVTLPSPEPGDTEAHPTGLQLRRSRNGTPYTWAIDNLPIQLTLNFSYVNRNKIIEMINFFKEAIGHQITYTDYLGQDWKVIITNDIGEFTHAARKNNTFTLTLEGYRA